MSVGGVSRNGARLMSLSDLAELVAGILLSFGGSGAIVLGMSNWLGKVWAERLMEKEKTRYQKEIEDFKAQGVRLLEQEKAHYQAELEALRHEKTTLFSRISKIHRKEFEILPKAWQLLHEAYGAALHLTEKNKPAPDFGGMSAAHLKEFIEGCPVAGVPKSRLQGQKPRAKMVVLSRRDDLAQARQCQRNTNSAEQLSCPEQHLPHRRPP
jgi:hypothetical protein